MILTKNNNNNKIHPLTGSSRSCTRRHMSGPFSFDTRVLCLTCQNVPSIALVHLHSPSPIFGCRENSLPVIWSWSGFAIQRFGRNKRNDYNIKFKKKIKQAIHLRNIYGYNKCNNVISPEYFQSATALAPRV